MTFEELINFFGTQQKAADAIGLKQPTIHGWQERGIPEGRQAQYHLITNGALKADIPERAAP